MEGAEVFLDSFHRSNLHLAAAAKVAGLPGLVLAVLVGRLRTLGKCCEHGAPGFVQLAGNGSFACGHFFEQSLPVFEGFPFP